MLDQLPDATFLDSLAKGLRAASERRYWEGQCPVRVLGRDRQPSRAAESNWPECVRWTHHVGPLLPAKDLAHDFRPAGTLSIGMFAICAS